MPRSPNAAVPSPIGATARCDTLEPSREPFQLARANATSAARGIRDPSAVDEDQSRGVQDLSYCAKHCGSRSRWRGLEMERLIFFVTFLALSVAGTLAHAQGAGDPQGGLALAQRVCSECHAIRKGEVRSPNSRSPTFSELAAAPGMTSIALMVALTTPHAGMPMFMLTAEQREDVIAYILGLR
jgi:mono/diheme cytochrome c family protein